MHVLQRCATTRTVIMTADLWILALIAAVLVGYWIGGWHL